jgi:hypothetical protein
MACHVKQEQRGGSGRRIRVPGLTPAGGHAPHPLPLLARVPGLSPAGEHAPFPSSLLHLLTFTFRPK